MEGSSEEDYTSSGVDDETSSDDSITRKDMPKEIIQMIASGISPKEILSLCQSDRQLNRQVCENPEFYRTLLRRDFPNWSYSMAPQEILPIEATFRNDEWLGDLPVYHGNPHRLISSSRNQLLKHAKLPGSGNTVKIHDQDYIFYYFMWAPRDHKMVNYNQKFTDQEIIQDIANKEIYERGEMGTGVFGLSEKRKTLILNNMGIMQIDVKIVNFPKLFVEKASVDWINKLREANFEVFSYFDYFKHPFPPTKEQARVYVWEYQYDKEGNSLEEFLSNLDRPQRRIFNKAVNYFIDWRNFSLWHILFPRTLTDLSLAYYDNFNRKVFSLAFLAALAARDNSTTPKTEYENLVKRYGIVEQLTELKNNIPNMNDEQKYWLMLQIRILFESLNDPDIFPATEKILWPRDLTYILQSMKLELDIPQ
jgi:hypothetical protein